MSGIKAMNFIGTLGIELPSTEIFVKLGDATALRRNKYGEFYRSNYDRGPLLYALTATHRPKTILEFGTGRGYGCLCMAWAMDDYGINGRIYTIDITRPNEPFPWPIDWGDGAGPRVEHLARNELWPKVIPSSRLSRIEQLTGFSGQVMSRYQGPSVDMAFIDGGHGYETVRHDFYSLLQVAQERVVILFDDYVTKPGFGVQELVDKEISCYCKVTLIYTYDYMIGNEKPLEDKGQHVMALVTIDQGDFAIVQSKSKAIRMRELVRSYRRKEKKMILKQLVSRVLRRLQIKK